MERVIVYSLFVFLIVAILSETGILKHWRDEWREKRRKRRDDDE